MYSPLFLLVYIVKISISNYGKIVNRGYTCSTPIIKYMLSLVHNRKVICYTDINNIETKKRTDPNTMLRIIHKRKIIFFHAQGFIL